MKKIVLTGFCRTGTTSIARLFGLFDIPSHHQKMGPGKNNMKPFDFLHPPERVQAYIKRKGKALRESKGFEASWEFAHYMYNLSKEAPDVEWLIMLREPSQACNSLKAYNRKNASIEKLAILYNETMIRIYLQSWYMIPKTKWMDFEKYIRNEYTIKLLSLFDIEPDIVNMKKASHHLAQKVRSSGNYKIHNTDLFEAGREINNKIKERCQEL